MLKSKCITIETTNLCNANCIMCPREKYSHELKSMDFELFKKIVDDSVEMGAKRIVFGGFGDSFCDPLLIKRLEYIKNNFKDIEITTASNGFGMKEKFLNAVIKYFDELSFSFYGMDKETHKKIHRGFVDFDTTKDNILRLIDRKKNLGSKKPYLIMRFLILDLNSHQIQTFIDFWENKVDEVMVWKPHNYLDGRNYRVLDKSKIRSCGRPFSDNLNIAVDGKVTVCCFDYNKKLVIGDLNKESIQEILNGEELKKIREIHRTKNFDGHLCGMCDQLNLREDVLVYSSNKERKVGCSNSARVDYIEKAQKFQG